MVVEAAFAGELGLRTGDPVTVGGHRFQVAGVAATAAMPPYPSSSCWVTHGCADGVVPAGQTLPPGVLRTPGLVWLTRADLISFATDPVYATNVRLADPAAAPAWAATHGGPPDGSATAAKPGRIALGRPAFFLQPWTEIQAAATELARDAQILLLAEYLLVALLAAVAGLVTGALTAPLLIGSSAGLLGAAHPAMTVSTVPVVFAVALGVAVVATLVPALRAARRSTVGSLADAPRPPRRIGWLITISARLPVPLLLAVRLAGRRPRRAVLAVVSVAVTVSGIYVLLILNRFLDGDGPYDAAQVRVLRHVLLTWTVVLLVLAAVNAIVITWATVLDNRHSSSLARALGATPGTVTTALAAAQVLPALLGAVLGVPLGLGFFALLMAVTGGDGGRAMLPSAAELVGVVLAVVVAVAALTAIPARWGRTAMH